MLSKSLIQFSVDGQACVPSLLLGLRPNYGGSNEDNGESESEVAQSCLTLCDPMDCSLPGSSVHGIFQAIVLKWIAISFSTGIFPTQGSNPGLLHCRQMLYHLSHQGSLKIMVTSFKRSPAHTVALSASDPAAGHH